MQHQKIDIFTSLLNEDYENEQNMYTLLQSPSSSSMSNSAESPNIINNFSELSQQSHDNSFKPFLLSLEDKHCLKEILLSWNMEYLYETCLG